MCVGGYEVVKMYSFILISGPDSRAGLPAVFVFARFPARRPAPVFGYVTTLALTLGWLPISPQKQNFHHKACRDSPDNETHLKRRALGTLRTQTQLKALPVFQFTPFNFCPPPHYNALIPPARCNYYGACCPGTKTPNLIKDD